jgi:hypothetical protein
MAIAGTFPEAGVRIALDLRAADAAAASYRGEAFTPLARYELSLFVDATTGKGKASVERSFARDGQGAAPALEAADLAFVAALGTQLWRQFKAPADQGGGQWSRRIQRWRGPK